MEFEEFAARAAEIEAASADTEIVALVTDLLSNADGDLPALARFVQGRVFPAYTSKTLDVGPSLCYEAIARAAEREVGVEDVEAAVAETGDVGAAAASYEFGRQQGLAAFGKGGNEDDLTVSEIDEKLRWLADTDGDGSQDRKIETLFGLLNRCSPDEARYLARLVLSEMRIGVGEGTVRDAIAEAYEVHVETVERALQVTNDYGEVAEVAREEGEAGLSKLELRIGRPVQAMLAQAGTVTDAIEDWGETVVEWKMDGARVQVHHDGEDVAVFSRNMEDVTAALPEVVEFVETHCESPAILDGEVVAVDGGGDPLPFQEVLRRFRRKYDVAAMREEVPIEFHAFDCLHAGGEDLLEASLLERRDRLEGVLDVAVSEFDVTDDADEIETVETAALEAGHEGIMLKNPESAYTPGRRGKNWLKRKPDVETLDLVVTGAEWGEGRRASFFGTFETATRTPDGYETVGKVATGVTDEQLAELTDLLKPHVRSEQGKEIDLEPAVVFEVGYEEIQESPTYSSGYALRFPRFLAVREDKDPEDADSVERVERLAENQ